MILLDWSISCSSVNSKRAVRGIGTRHRANLSRYILSRELKTRYNIWQLDTSGTFPLTFVCHGSRHRAHELEDRLLEMKGLKTLTIVIDDTDYSQWDPRGTMECVSASRLEFAIAGAPDEAGR